MQGFVVSVPSSTQETKEDVGTQKSPCTVPGMTLAVLTYIENLGFTLNPALSCLSCVTLRLT